MAAAAVGKLTALVFEKLGKKFFRTLAGKKSLTGLFFSAAGVAAGLNLDFHKVFHCHAVLFFRSLGSLITLALE